MKNKEREMEIQEAIDRGFDSGRKKGYEEGEKQGYENGYAKGFREGTKKGYEEYLAEYPTKPKFQLGDEIYEVYGNNINKWTIYKVCFVSEYRFFGRWGFHSYYEYKTEFETFTNKSPIFKTYKDAVEFINQKLLKGGHND